MFWAIIVFAISVIVMICIILWINRRAKAPPLPRLYTGKEGGTD